MIKGVDENGGRVVDVGGQCSSFYDHVCSHKTSSTTLQLNEPDLSNVYNTINPQIHVILTRTLTF